MVVVKWCKCLNVKICLVNPPTPVGDLKWVTEHTSMRKCGESKVQGNVVTMELEKMVQARMVQGWQVWKCFNCCIDVCAIDLNNSIALVNMDMEDNDDISQLQLDSTHTYSDCFRVIVDTSPSTEDTPPIPERDPHSIENFNLLQEFVDEYLADAERVMEKRIRQYVKEQNEIFNHLKSKVNTERTIIWRKMCNVVANPTPPPTSSVLSSTPSASAAPANPAPTSRSRASSVSRPHSRSVSGAVAPFAGGFVGSGSMTSAATGPALSSTFGTVSGFHVPGSTPTAPVAKPNNEVLPDAVVPVIPIEIESVQPITPPKPANKPENVTKWQSSRPASTEIKPNTRMKRSTSPNIFNFDDEEPEDFEMEHEESDDEPEEVSPPTPTLPQPKVVDSSHLLGSSLPVSIPARTQRSAQAPTARLPPQPPQNPAPKKTGSNLNLSSTTSSSPARGPTTVSMSTVSMANVTNVSSTAPTHQYHALRPQTQNVAPMSTSASDVSTPELMVPKQSWREDYLGETIEESIPVAMASSFTVPLSLSRRMKSLI